MSQDILRALLDSFEGVSGTTEGRPVEVHVLDEDSMSPELSQLLSSSGVSRGLNGYAVNPQAKGTVRQEVPVAESKGTPSDKPKILIVSKGRQYTSLKKFLASEGCKNIDSFLEVWKNTDDFAQALNSSLAIDYSDITVTVFNNIYNNYVEACNCFHLAHEDVKDKLDEKFKPLGQDAVTSKSLSKELSRVIFTMCQNS